MILKKIRKTVEILEKIQKIQVNQKKVIGFEKNVKNFELD